MYDLQVEIKPAAVAKSAQNSPEMIALAQKVAKELASIEEVVPEVAFNASEDITLMVEQVQKQGGKALAAIFGTPIHGGHHNSTFDLDETVIRNAAEFFIAMHGEITG
jgi:aminobenzoyl-glutamate utilization protein A